MQDLIKMTTGEFIKILNGDYIDNSEYKKYYDIEDSKIIVQNVILDEHIAFNSEIKPFFKSVWVWDSVIRSIAFAFLELDLWIEFNGVKFIENVMFINKLKPQFRFNDCSFKFDIRFVDVESEEITFSECRIRYVAFFNGKIERLVFSDTIFSRYSFFRNIDCTLFGIYNSTFQTLEFSRISGRSFEISNSKGVELQFNSTFSKDILFQISDINILNISYNLVINLGLFCFTGTYEYSKNKLNNLQIKNSDLGKMTLIDLDLSGFKLFFKSSKITDLFLTGTRMPLPENINADNFEQKRQILSQLKKVYENRGDLIEAGKYQAEELNIHLKTLKNGWEKMNLSLNKWTNNHGQNLSRAFWVMIGGSLVCYSIYCLLLGFRLDFSLLGLNELGRITLYFPEYLNPIRKVDVLYNALKINSKVGFGISPSVSAWDNISRIFIAYFLYQFIAAFRKHGKKSS